MENKRKERLKSAIALINRTPPSEMKSYQSIMIKLAPNIQQNLLEKIELPHSNFRLKSALEFDGSANEYFIKTQFNRDGTGHRSPYSNEYFPPQKQAYLPSPNLREFQQKANVLFKQYTKLYYENGVGNFYVSQQQQQQKSFKCGYFAKKGQIMIEVDCEPSAGFCGNWNSFNIVDVKIDGNNKVIYKLNTTILIQLKINSEKIGEIDLSGSYHKNKQQSVKISEQKQLDEFHIANIGRMIEDMQTVMRQQVESVYVSKTKHIIFSTRLENTKEADQRKSKLAIEVMNNMKMLFNSQSRIN